MSILKVNTIQDKGGNALLVSDGSGTISSGGAITNTPSFNAYLQTASQSIADETHTVIQFNATTLDTDSKFDTSTYRFTPTIAGEYFIYASGLMNGAAQMEIHIRKNGTRVLTNRRREASNAQNECLYVGGVVDANTTDYFDVTFYQNSNGPINLAGNDIFKTFFGGYKLIGA